MKKTLAILLASTLLGGLSLQATPYYNVGSTVNVTVIDINPGADAIVNIANVGNNIQMRVGLINVVIDGESDHAFCVDPFQPISDLTESYQVAELYTAPVGWWMGQAKSDAINALWDMYYSPAMSDELAAGVQLAIWEIVGEDNFSVVGDDHGASALIASLATYQGGGANLVALTDRTNQDLVVQNIPDGGTTVLLLGFGFVGLALAKRRLRK